MTALPRPSVLRDNGVQIPNIGPKFRNQPFEVGSPSPHGGQLPPRARGRELQDVTRQTERRRPTAARSRRSAPAVRGFRLPQRDRCRNRLGTSVPAGLNEQHDTAKCHRKTRAVQESRAASPRFARAINRLVAASRGSRISRDITRFRENSVSHSGLERALQDQVHGNAREEILEQQLGFHGVDEHAGGAPVSVWLRGCRSCAQYYGDGGSVVHYV